MKKYNLRSLAAQIIKQVIEKKQLLSNVLPLFKQKISDKDNALVQELCFGVLRTLLQMRWFLNKIVSYPIKKENSIIHYLIMVGFYQLLYTRIPSYAAIFETVEGAVFINYPQLKGLINGVLRQFQRQQKMLLSEFLTSDYRYLHPIWLLKRLQTLYPKKWKSIVEANNQHPPMWLRINRNHHSRSEWLKLLQKSGIKGFPHSNYPDAVRLDVPVKTRILPGFEQGWVTVQDISAQDCVTWLDPKNGERILDLCAAPGGKTTHILETALQASVMAVDINAHRISNIYNNLKRLGIKAEVKQGDARTPIKWCKNEKFDKILIDAPCSSTGVIRRHPDIKWLRQEKDVKKLVRLQSEILDAIWPYLRYKGTLVYVTCSIFPEENNKQIANFLRKTPNAMLHITSAFKAPWEQKFPEINEGDGFFYARLIKI